MMKQFPEIEDVYDALNVAEEGYDFWKHNTKSRFLAFSVANSIWSVCDWIFWDTNLLPLEKKNLFVIYIRNIKA